MSTSIVTPLQREGHWTTGAPDVDTPSLAAAAGFTDLRPLTDGNRQLSFLATDLAGDREVEVKLLPWVRTDQHRSAIHQQTRLTQLMIPDRARQIVRAQLADAPPRLVLATFGPSLQETLTQTPPQQRIRIASNLVNTVQRCLLGGLLHGALSLTEVCFQHEQGILIDYHSRFYAEQTLLSEPTAELDAASTLSMLRKILAPIDQAPIDQAPIDEHESLLATLAGHQRGQLRSLLQTDSNGADELERLDQWARLLSQLDSDSRQRSLDPDGRNPGSTTDNSIQFDDRDAGDQTCETSLIDVASSLPAARDDITGAVDVAPIPTDSVSRPPTAQLGDQIGRFRLAARLGAGGMGVVFRGRDVITDAEVAVKILRPQGGDIAQAVRRFQKEARLLASIENQYVTRLIDSGYDRGFHYLAMEFVDGTNLKDWMQSQQQLEESAALHLVADIARALVDAHEVEIIHRDIKPENVLLGYKKRGEHDPQQGDLDQFNIKLSDFGIARSIQQSASMEVTKPGSMLGTPVYMSPEQCKGTETVSPASDIYSLGITLYALLAGQPPFQSDDAMKLAAMHCFDPPPDIQKSNRRVSDATAELIGRMLAKQPATRPADASQLVREIEQLLRGEISGFDLHPRLPDHMPGKDWERVFQWDLKSSAADLWQYVSNTERINRATGLQSVEYRTERGPDRGLHRFGSFRLAGIPIEWEEHPFEWIEGRRMGILREFSSGPFCWFLSLVELTPLSQGGTRLTHTVRIGTRNFFGRMIATVEAGWKGRRALDRIYRRIDRALTNEQPGSIADPYEPSIKLGASAQRRIDQRLEAMIDLGVAPDWAAKLVEFLSAAAPQSLAQIRPLDLADQFSIPSEEMLDICLVATHCGLLQMRWDILCPTCRAPASTVGLLTEIQQHTGCEACDAEFRSDIASAIELVFQVHPEIREFDDGTYCIGGPEHSPHVVTQLRLLPGERIELTVPLETGDYLLRNSRAGNSLSLRARSRNAPSRLDTRLSSLGQISHTPNVRAGVMTLSLTNDLEHTEVVRLERTILRSNVVTAATASALPRFRELFPEQVFRRENPIAAEELTLLATRIVAVESIYAQLGDRDAYQQIRQALQTMEDCVRGHRGAVIKSVGEMLLSSFCDSTQAIAAATAMDERVTGECDQQGLTIASAVHRGSLLVTTQNGQLDYFGTTARQAQALCQKVTDGVALTDAVFTDAAVQERINLINAPLSHQAIDLPGARQRLVQHLRLSQRSST